jgi:hypothetical protein
MSSARMLITLVVGCLTPHFFVLFVSFVFKMYCLRLGAFA